MSRYGPIVIANLLPLIGVLFFGWSLADACLLYWFEAAAYGLIVAVRILLVRAIPAAVRTAGALIFLAPYAITLTFYLALLVVFIVNRAPSGAVFTFADLTASLSILARLDFAAAAVLLVLTHGIPAIIRDQRSHRTTTTAGAMVIAMALGAGARLAIQIPIVLVGGALYASFLPSAGALILCVLIAVKTTGDVLGQTIASLRGRARQAF